MIIFVFIMYTHRQRKRESERERERIYNFKIIKMSKFRTYCIQKLFIQMKFFNDEEFFV